MLNYETLLSSYDDKLTLMQWLKKVEAALKDASAVDFKVNKKGDATLTFSIVFDDGSELESGEIVLQQGESVASAAIVNGHLILTLTNGDELDAGSLFNGDVNITGTITCSKLQSTGDISASGALTAQTISQSAANYSISFDMNSSLGLLENIYNRFEVINNVLYVIVNLKLTNNTENNISLVNATLAFKNFAIDSAIASKIIDIEGDPLTANKANRTLVMASCGIVFTDGVPFQASNYKNRAVLNFTNYENHPSQAVVVIATSGETFTLNAGASCYITARAALTLI